MSAIKLSQKAITALDDNLIRLNVAIALGFTDTWVRSLTAKNKPNGPLTTVAAVRTIQTLTGMGESEVLELVESGHATAA